jgi:bifunctional enzyme CysN/CysC
VTRRPNDTQLEIDADIRRAFSGMRASRSGELTELLQSLDSPAEELKKKPFRLPVVGQADVDGASGATGTVASGTVKVGDFVRVTGQSGRVLRVLVDGRDAGEATAGDGAVLLLEGATAAPGDLISIAERPAEEADQFEATVAWFDETPLLRGRNYVFELGAKIATATIGSLKRKLEPASPSSSAPQKFEPGEVGVCNLRLDRAVAFDPYRENRATGGFRLTDPRSGATVGVGMLHFALRRAQNVHWQAIDVNKSARSASKGQRPCVLWYTGLSGAGKSTIANLVDKKLHAMGRHTYLLDGDNVRHGLNKDLGFTAADRVENIRRIAEVAKLMVDAGLIVGTAFISPFRAERSMARTLLADGEFIEIFVSTPLGVAEQRDPKGLYKKARRGELKNFTGIDSPYEAPENPELTIDTTATTPEAAADLVIGMLEDRGILEVG